MTGPGGPVVVGANWFRFRPSEHIYHPLVASVSFIWPLQGGGLIRSRGESFRIDGASMLRLPWRHDVDYRADARAPFHVGTIHLVPWHEAAVPVDARVAHREDDPLVDAAWRRDTDGPTRPQLLSTMSSAGRHVVGLASYAVERFLEGATDERPLRALGELIAEADAEFRDAEPVAVGRPVAVQLMMDHVVEHLDHPFTVQEIAAAGACSTTTAQRLFARYTGQSVLAWARRRQMDEAALLLRTSSLRAGEVARMVGFTDPLYFSRVFRAAFSVPPSQYVAGQLRP